MFSSIGQYCTKSCQKEVTSETLDITVELTNTTNKSKPFFVEGHEMVNRMSLHQNWFVFILIHRPNDI